MDVTALLNAASGPALFLVALVVIVKVLWSDRRAEKLTVSVITKLQTDVSNLGMQLAWEQDRRADLENALTAAGLTIPPARPRPVLIVTTADRT